MSFIGRAAVWTPGNGMEDNRSHHLDGVAGARLTPLNVMTGSRIAASRNGVVRWVGGPTWDEVANRARTGSRLTEQLRRPYQQLFEALGRHSNRSQEPRMCPRCGQAPHNDWGHEYERLVCMEITVA